MKLLRFLLFPFSLLYGIPVVIRNFLYDKKILKSTTFDVPIIVIGNLCTGGSGKSPLTLYLADHFSDTKNIALLSRGYGRKSIGFREVKADDLAVDVGDEPLMFKKKLLEKVNVFVDANRVRGIIEILTHYPKTDLIILDDALQHRAVKGSLHILLSQEKKPFFKDFLLPVGNLREMRSGYKRAEILIFTKVSDLHQAIKYPRYIQHSGLSVYFSKIDYGPLRWLQKRKVTCTESVDNVILVTGIAQGESLKKHIESLGTVQWIKYKDHHNYSEKDILAIHKIFDKLATSNKVIITTEKDAVKIKPLLEKMNNIENCHWAVQTITPQFNNESSLLEKINQYVGKN